MNLNSDQPEEPHEPVVDRAQRKKTRQQIWLVLLGLLLAATAYTGWRWYQGEYVVGERPVPWRKAEWPIVDQQLERGRRMAIFVADPDDEETNENLLDKFETETIRKQLFYSQRLPLKLHMPDDNELRNEIFEQLKIKTIPCCVITSEKENAAILSGQVTSEEIASKMTN